MSQKGGVSTEFAAIGPAVIGTKDGNVIRS